MRKSILALFSFVPLLCICQIYPNIEPTSDGGQTEPFGSVDSDTHPFVRRKVNDITKMMDQVKETIGDLVIENDEIEIRVINSYPEEVEKRKDVLIALISGLGGDYVLVDDNILRLHDHDGYVMVEFHQIIDDINGFQKVQTTNMAGKTLIIINFGSHSKLYKSPIAGNWSTISHVQTISSKQYRPVDAEFIHFSGRLFLAIIYDDGHGGAANVMVYEWLGSHMDEIYDLPAAGAVDIAVVSKEDNFYVVIAEKQKNHVIIYKLDGKNPYRFHRIAVQTPTTVLSYKVYGNREDDFIIILGSDGAQIFKLNDDEFTFHHSVKFDGAPVPASIAYIEAAPVLVTTNGNNVTLSSLLNKSLRNIATLTTAGDSVSMVRVWEPYYGLYRVVASTHTKRRTLLQITNIAARRNIVVSPELINPEETCLMHLTDELEATQTILEDLSRKVTGPDIAENINYDDDLLLDHEIELVSSKIGAINIVTETQLDFNEDKFHDIEKAVANNIERLEAELPNLVYENEPVVVNEHVVIDKDIKARKLKASSVNAGTLNGYDFKPDNILMKGQEYPFNADQILDELHVKNLEVPNMFLETFLLEPKVGNLIANNILISENGKINGINLNQVVLKNYEGVIKGEKVINDINTSSTIVENINGIDIEKELSKPPQVDILKITGSMDVQNLIVDTINSVNIEQLFSDIYLKNNNDTIEGDLSISGNAYIDNLETDVFQDVPANEYFTKTTDQVINSDLEVEEIYFEKAHFDFVNGLDIKKDVALKTKTNFIQTPTVIDSLLIEKDLRLNCDNKSKQYCGLLNIKNGNMSQIYKKHVYIKGSVVVDDLEFADDALLYVGEQPFTTNLEGFWIKDKKQKIPNGITFSAGLTLDHLDASYINEVPIQNYLTLNSDFTNTLFEFDTLLVDGNFDVREDTECHAVTRFGENVVTAHGNHTITGKKVFRNEVIVKDLEADFINEIATDDIVHPSDDIGKDFEGKLLVKRVQVNGDLILGCNLDAEVVNKFSMAKVADRALKINEDAVLGDVTFTKSLEGSSIFIESGPLINAIKSIDDEVDDVNVTILGNLKVAAGINKVETINGIDFETYIGQVVDKNIGGIIGGRKTFAGGLRINSHLYANTVNGVDMDNIIKTALRKVGDQIVTGHHTIKNVQAVEVNSEYLNQLPVENIVDGSDSPIVINTTLLVEDAKVYNHLVAPTKLDVNAYKDFISKTESTCWDTMYANGGISWNIGGKINNILENAAHACHDNKVTGNVVFEGPVTVENISSKNFMNDVNIHYIAEDAVLKSETIQVIAGRKLFQNEVNVDNLRVLNQMITNNVKNFDINEIDSKLANKYAENIFQGHVIFVGNNSIETVKARNIIGIPELEEMLTVDYKGTIKHLNVETARVRGDLSANKINEVNLDHFVQSIVRLEGETQHLTGDIYFDSVGIDNLYTNKINKVDVDEIIFDRSDVNITIEGDLVFNNTIEIQGNVIIDFLNNINVNEAYENTIWPGENIIVDGNMEVPGSSKFDKGISAKIDGINIGDMYTEAMVETKLNINKSIEKINIAEQEYQILKTYVDGLYPIFMYLEYVQILDIGVESITKISASSISSKCYLRFNTDDIACSYEKQCDSASQVKITIDPLTWQIINSQENKGQRDYPIIDKKGREIASICINEDYAKSSTSLSIKLMQSSNGKTSPSRVEDLTSQLSGQISDVKFVITDEFALVVIASFDATRSLIIETSLVILLHIESHSVVSITSFQTCGAKSADIVLLGDHAHIFIANSRYCMDDLPYIFSFSFYNEQLTPLASTEVILGKQVAADILSDGRIVALYAVEENSGSVIIEISYSMELYGYIISHKTKLGAALVYGMELTRIYGVRNYVTLLNIAMSDKRLLSFENSKGWQLHSSVQIDGLTGLGKLVNDGQPYLLVTSQNKTIILSFVVLGL